MALNDTQPCILLVEPDILVRHPLAEYLRECGYRVCEALAAVEAKALLQDSKLRVDIALIDAAGNGGFALANWMRAHHTDIEIVLAGTVTKAVEKAGDLCADGPQINKPYDHQAILDQIKQLLAKRAKTNN
jgi:DNA-binding NtrC family response regulator